MNKLIESRNKIVDLLKGIAVLFMIQVHLVELFANPEVYNSKLGSISLFLGAAPVAPTFMIIMGYFLSRSNKSTNQLIFRGILLFCLGMILNCLLNLNLLLSVSKGLLKLNIFPFIFGVDILQFAGLAIIFISLLEKLIEKSFMIPIILAILSPLIGSY